jgi:hypothetical protein
MSCHCSAAATQRARERECVWLQVLRTQTGAVADQSFLLFPGEEVVPRLQHGVLTFVSLSLDYALMLAAMSFNVGIFLAVVSGLTVGTFIFRVVGARAMERMQARCLSCPCSSSRALPLRAQASGHQAKSGPHFVFLCNLPNISLGMGTCLNVQQQSFSKTATLP